VPWEMARPSANQPTLGERNLVVRVVHDRDEPDTLPLALGQDECLRVLFVFAEACGSRPLAARRERRELRKLFDTEIYPERRIVAHFLTHGVTRERLQAQIQENGGYHIVHWSGHGHLNLLDLAKPGGAKDHLSGAMRYAVGVLGARLFALGYGEEIVPVLHPRDVDHGRHAALEQRVGGAGVAGLCVQRDVSEAGAPGNGPGWARTSLGPRARQSLLDPNKHDPARYVVCDHATPVLYGAEQPGLCLQKGRSPALDTRDPRLHLIAELTTAGHEHFEDLLDPFTRAGGFIPRLCFLSACHSGGYWPTRSRRPPPQPDHG
jgi:hypothetical protein